MAQIKLKFFRVVALPSEPEPNSIYLVLINQDRFRMIETDDEGNMRQEGVINHEDLLGLNNDDHPQYLNTSRGDARYLIKTSELKIDGTIEAVNAQFPNVSIDFEDDPLGWDKENYLYVEYYLFYKKAGTYYDYAYIGTERDESPYAENYNIILDWENNFQADSIEVYRYDSISDQVGLLASLSATAEQFIDDYSLSLNTESAMPTPDVSGVITCDTLNVSTLNVSNLAASVITSGTLSDARLSSNIPKLNQGNIFSAVNTFNASPRTALNIPILVWNSTQQSTDNFGLYHYNIGYSAPASKTTGFLYNYMNVTSVGASANIIAFQNNIAMSAAASISALKGMSFILGNYSGTITNFYGAEMTANQGGGAVTNLVGGVFTAAHQYGGTLTSLIGGLFRAEFTGSITSTLGEAGVFQVIRQSGSPVVTTLRGISIRDWNASVTATNSYGIFIDNTIDKGSSAKYCIYSTSTSLSYFKGDIEIDDNSKGFILRSPDNSRWRITVDNSGNLSATAA